METVTENDLQEIERLLNKLDPSPWAINHYIPVQPVIGQKNSWTSNIIKSEKDEIGFPFDSWSNVVAHNLDRREDRYPDDPGVAPNAEFIVAAKNKMSALISTIRQAREERKEAMDILAEWVESVDNTPTVPYGKTKKLLRYMGYE